jgi:CspA family cold shock protein
LEKGVVKWFNGDRGFGFIEPNDGSEDLFVHQSNIIMAYPEDCRTLAEGDMVSYEIEQTDKGLNAVQVRTL